MGKRKPKAWRQPAKLIKDLQWVLSTGAVPVLACEGEDGEPEVFTISIPFHDDLHGEGATLAEAIEAFIPTVEAYAAQFEETRCATVISAKA